MISEFKDYKIKDFKLALQGRQQIDLARTEMPGLLRLLEDYVKVKPLQGAKIAGCLHITAQTAVLIETLVALGAKVRWCASNPLSTNDAVAAALAKNQIPIFAWKGQSEEEYQWCLKQTLEDEKDWYPNLLMDDGGDLTTLLHETHHHLIPNVIGVSEETTTGIHRLENLWNLGQLRIAVMNVNDAVTKSTFDNFYGSRESLLSGLKAALNTMIAGKKVMIVGFGEVGKGCAEACHSMGADVCVAEVDPICALQAAMKGYAVKTVDEACMDCDLFITATGNVGVITAKHLLNMKDRAIICNMGHFNAEIEIEALRSYPWREIKPHVHEIRLPSGKHLILLAEGRLVNLVCAEGHPSFVMSMSFTNQLLAQVELWQHKNQYKPGIYRLPKKIDEQVARYHLEYLGGHLTILNPAQSKYIGVKADGPYKSDYYRY